MTALPEPDLDRSWAVTGAGRDLRVGPLRALRDVEPRRAVVTLLPPGENLPIGEPVADVQVRESGVREFAVRWHEGPAADVVVADNPAGGNRVGWSTDGERWWVTDVDGGARAVVHLRFVLRHLTTICVAGDTGGRAVHAVTARLPGGGVVAVAGATTTGKTRLVNRLIAAGIAGPVVDDDCPIVSSDGAVHSLVPARHEVVRAASERLAALVLLRADGVDAPEDPAAFLERTPCPWPAVWLPSPPAQPLTSLPGTVPVLAVGQRIDEDEAAVDRVVDFLGRTA